MTTDSLFTATPAVVDADDAQAINTATVFTVTEAVTCTHHRCYLPTSDVGTITGRLYELTSDTPTGTLLAEKAYSATTPGAYNTVAWDTPVSLVTGKAYLVQTHNTDTKYVATSGAFSAGTVTSPNGLLVAIQTGTDPVLIGVLRNGYFKYGALALADQNGGGANFFADVFVTNATAVSVEVAIMLPEPVVAVAAVESIPGAIAVTLPEPVVAVGVVESIPAAIAVTLPEPVVSAAATVAVPVTAEVAVSLPEPVVAVTVTVDNPTGGAMAIAEVMQAIADRLATLGGWNVFSWPPGSLSPPAAVVNYPDEVVFDDTYGRGFDLMWVPLIIVVGKATARTTPIRLGQYVDSAGARSVKQLLEGEDWDHPAFDSLRVERAVFDAVTIGGVEYMAALFDLEISGSGGG